MGSFLTPIRKKFDTELTPQEEQQFQTWKSQYAPNDSGEDYDLRGAYKTGLKPDAETGHWSDKFKKPNHPTFSDESQYAEFGNPGHWSGVNHDQYTPGKVQPTMLPMRKKSILGNAEGMNPNFANPALTPVDFSAQPQIQPQPQLSTKEDALLQLPEMQDQSRQALAAYAEEQPKWDNYHPSALTRIAGGMGGFAAGWQGGAGEGVKTGRDILETPFRRKVEQWKLGLAPRTTAAKIEGESNTDNINRAYKMARLKQLDRTKDSAAYTGTNPMDRYIDPTGSVHTVMHNTKSGIMTEKTGDTETPLSGIPSNWRKETPDRLTSVISPESTQGYANLSSMNRNALLPPGAQKQPTGAFSDQPVAENQFFPVNGQGEMTGQAVGTRTAKPTNIPGVIAPGSRKTPKNEEQRRAETSYAELDEAAQKFSKFFPEAKDATGPIDSWIQWARGKTIGRRPEVVEVQSALAKIEEMTKRRLSGLNVPQHEMENILKFLPSEKTPDDEVPTLFNQFVRATNAALEARGQKPMAASEMKAKTKNSIPQASRHPKWVKGKNDKIWVETSAGSKDFRAVAEGDVLDPEQEVK